MNAFEFTPTVGFTGTRSGMSKEQSHRTIILLDEITNMVDNSNWSRDFVFRHGGCVGADMDFHRLSLYHAADSWIAGITSGNTSMVVHPGVSSKNANDMSFRGDYTVHEGVVELEAKTHFARNRDIVQMSDFMIACPWQTPDDVDVIEYQKRGIKIKGGTWYTIEYARRQEVPLTIIYRDGTIETTNWYYTPGLGL